MTGILIGEIAPDFTCGAVSPSGEMLSSFNLHNALENKYGLIFFYPLDFTFVCPSELIALSNRIGHLRELNVEVISVSSDSHHTHNAWRNTEPASGGVGNVEFTMASDLNGQIIESYGLRSIPNRSYYDPGVAMRGTFITDKNMIVRSQTINDEPLGRNIDEFIRTIEALIFFEENGQVCPAGWNKGLPGMLNTKEVVSEFLSAHHKQL